MIKPVTIVIITGIALLSTLAIGAVSIPRPVSAIFPYSCSTCGAYESITGNALGVLACSNVISYPDTQINFNAVVPVKTTGAAKGTVILTATIGKVQGTVISGPWDPSAKTYSISGTSTSDNVCGVPDSPFTVSGPAGSSVPVSMIGKYDFKGTGDVKTSHAKA